MVKRYKTVLSVLLVVLIALTTVLVTGWVDIHNINKVVTDNENQNDPTINETYRDVFSTVTDVNVPLLPTDISGVYYGMDKQGDVTFWNTKGGLKQIPETGSYEIKVQCSGQTLTAQIHYIELDGHTAGYGLFTNVLYEGVELYDYAFFKVTDFFPGYKNVSGSPLLMMADVDKTRFYSEEKVYSEIFTLDSNHKAKYFLNEDQRTQDLSAKWRTDYKMFTDDILGQTGSTLHFFSSRFYTAYDEYTRYDIMSTGGSGENVDNLRFVQDVASLNFWQNDSGVYYFRNSDEGESGGFSLYKYSVASGEETAVHWFEGSLEKDYIIDGSHLLNRKAGEIYNIFEDDISTIDYSGVVKNFSPDLFEISDNGKHVIVRGANNRNRPVVIIVDYENGTQKVFEDDVFGFIARVNVLDDGTCLLSMASDTAGSSYYQLVTNNLKVTVSDATASDSAEATTDA